MQPQELGKKCDGNFIDFAVTKVGYKGITMAKIFIGYRPCNDAL